MSKSGVGYRHKNGTGRNSKKPHLMIVAEKTFHSVPSFIALTLKNDPTAMYIMIPILSPNNPPEVVTFQSSPLTHSINHLKKLAIKKPSHPILK